MRNRAATLLIVSAALFACADQEQSPLEPIAPQFASGSSAANTFGARAYGLQVSVPLLGINQRVSDTGELPPQGGASEASLLNAAVLDVASVSVLHAAAVAQGNYSRAEASAADVNLLVAGNTIQAALLTARVEARCPNGVSARSDVVRLVINGSEIAVSGEPNQTIVLPVGRIIINEQTRSGDATTVNALHVIVPGIADVIVSSATAEIHCGGSCPPPHGDFVTGGGSISASGDRANFGVAGGIKQNGLWGHLTYIDHGTGMKVKGTGVTAYTITGQNSRHIEGTAEIDGVSGTYSVDLTDQGEPGRNDTFTIRLSNGYVASGKLTGGNIQLHKPDTSCN
jgi:hypothetical protein